jgi:hypothetical protein
LIFPESTSERESESTGERAQVRGTGERAQVREELTEYPRDAIA